MDTEKELREQLHRLARTIEEKAMAMGLSRARVKEIIASGEKAPVRVPRGRSKLLGLTPELIAH